MDFSTLDHLAVPICLLLAEEFLRYLVSKLAFRTKIILYRRIGLFAPVVA
jgi:hypothetical protein